MFVTAESCIQGIRIGVCKFLYLFLRSNHRKSFDLRDIDASPVFSCALKQPGDWVTCKLNADRQAARQPGTPADGLANGQTRELGEHFAFRNNANDDKRRAWANFQFLPVTKETVLTEEKIGDKGTFLKGSGQLCWNKRVSECVGNARCCWRTLIVLMARTRLIRDVPPARDYNFHSYRAQLATKMFPSTMLFT